MGNIPVNNGILSNILNIAEGVYSSTLTINSADTSDARMYFCAAYFTSLNVVAVGNVSLSIQSNYTYSISSILNLSL